MNPNAVQEERGPRNKKAKGEETTIQRRIESPSWEVKRFFNHSVSQIRETFLAAMLKMYHHSDLMHLTGFEKLVLALGRWSYFFVMHLVQQEDVKSIDFIKSQQTELKEVIASWQALLLNRVEYRFVEVLAVTGRDAAKHPQVIANKINMINEVVNLSLAKYQVLNFPLTPLRLTQISLLLTKLETVASPQNLIKSLFENNPHLVTQIINQIFVLQ